jgi:hypothetical protein
MRLFARQANRQKHTLFDTRYRNGGVLGIFSLLSGIIASRLRKTQLLQGFPAIFFGVDLKSQMQA